MAVLHYGINGFAAIETGVSIRAVVVASVTAAVVGESEAAMTMRNML